MIRVTISSITDRGIQPQFYEIFDHEVNADDYVSFWRRMAATAGVMIRVDRDDASEALASHQIQEEDQP